MIYLSNCIHQSGEDPKYPKWDTLIGILNNNNFDIKVKLQIYGEYGEEHLPIEFEIKALSSFALTFIPNNGLPNPPQDFTGHATLAFYQQTPFGPIEISNDINITVWSMLSGGNWDCEAPSIENPTARYLYNTKEYIFPYAIPNYENADHPGANAYVTGLSIQNFSPYDTDLEITYVVGQAYGNQGTKFIAKTKVHAYGGMRKHLHELLPELLSFNSEGHILITCNPSAKLFCSTFIATRNYLFSAAQAAQ